MYIMCTYVYNVYVYIYIYICIYVCVQIIEYYCNWQSVIWVVYINTQITPATFRSQTPEVLPQAGGYIMMFLDDRANN